MGSIDIHNRSDTPVSLTLQLAAILMPMGKGKATQPIKIRNHQVLLGRTDRLFPLLFLTGGPSGISSPYPALSLALKLMPDETHTSNWALVSKGTQQESYDTARQVTASHWQKKAQSALMQSRREILKIKTGNHDWDTSFLLTQITAMTHMVTQDQKGETPIFLHTRLPDQATSPGCSPGDQDDITTLETLHLSEVFLPHHADSLAKLVRKFLSQLDSEGRLASCRRRSDFIKPFQECPLLAQISLELYKVQQDKLFLKEIFSDLCRYIDSWLPLREKSPGKLCLAWEDPDQLQLSTGLFLFDIWEPSGIGLDIRSVDSPALAAMLLREIKAMQKIATALGEQEHQKHFGKIEKHLKKKILDFWQSEQRGFTYLDCQSQLSPERELYYPSPAKERFEISKSFTKPQRLQCHLHAHDDRTRVCKIEMIGLDFEGNQIIELFKSPDIRWVNGRAHLTSHALFLSLESIQITRLHPKDRILLQTADLTQCDITCLAPFWSGSLQGSQAQSLLSTFLDPEMPALSHGIPETWQCLHPLPEDLPIRVNVLWNTLIIKGLLQEGFTDQATTLFTRLMSTITSGLKQYNGFYPYYDHNTGKPFGTRNIIPGLVPVRLFLQIAGIRIFNHEKVAIWGTNPFPWPIEVQYQGLALRKEGSHTLITFPDGRSYQNDTETPVQITPAGAEK